jgi:hypothetical protein
MAELHFPEDFPIGALTTLAPIVRTGKITDRVSVGEAAWVLLGYGMGQWLGTGHASLIDSPDDDPGPVRQNAPVAATDAVGHGDALHALSALESLGKAPDGAQAAPVKARDIGKWAIKVARFVLPLILGL